MITVELPNGSTRSIEDGATSADLAESIGPSLAKAAVAAKIGEDIFNVVYSGREMFFKERKVINGKGANINPLNRGI